MVKYIDNKEDIDISTSHSLCQSEHHLTQTLAHLIEHVPKLTRQQRKHCYRVHHSAKNSSRKWSQTETKSFYQLLCHYGLDFTLMSYHPTFHLRRSQKELSNKYKKQLKCNTAIMNGTLNKIDQEGLFSIQQCRQPTQ